MLIRVFQKGFNYSQDGPGNRLVIHLQGCNMKCPWCSNPEGMNPKGVLITEREWLLDSCCIHGAVKNHELDRSICGSCKDMECIRHRRQKGIRLSYTEYEVEELVKECDRSRLMFFDGGGVTLTGGEISLQLEGVEALLRQLNKLSINCAIETNGSNPDIVRLIPLVDYWIMDVKHYDSDILRDRTGVGNIVTTSVLESVSEKHGNVLIRVPLIPGFNDSYADADEFAAFFRSHIRGKGVKIEFLKYHEFGKAKWKQCGMEYTMQKGHISDSTVMHFEDVMRRNDFTCIRT